MVMHFGKIKVSIGVVRDSVLCSICVKSVYECAKW